MPYNRGFIANPLRLSRKNWPIAGTDPFAVYLQNPPWQEVPGSATATTATLPVANAAEFFRLVKP